MFNSGAYSYVDLLTSAADYSWRRSEVLNNNISNIDTPAALLLLHIEAVLRRNGGDENVIRYRDITLNLSKSSISGNGNEIELSKNECRILNYMFRNSGKIVSRDDIMNYLWDDCEFVDDNTLTVNITRVRHKLAELGYGDVISTKRGQGYYIEA